MKEIRPFNFKGNTVRTVEKDGQAWFIAADVSKVLDIKNTTQALDRLDSDEKSMLNIGLSGGATNVVNEYGLYTLVLASRKPEAREFKRWVTHEVLPSIRTKGGYLTPEATEQALTDPDFIIRLATELKKERTRTAELEAVNTANTPKVLFADAVSASHTAILVGELAKILKGNGVEIGQNRLFVWMRNHGYLIRRNGTDFNMPTQRAMDMGLFKIKETAITHSDGHVTVSKTPKVTGKGQQYFIDLFLKEQVVA